MASDRPIIFSAPMVRALLEGRKTQTRRLAWRWEKRGGDHGHGHLRGPASPWQAMKPGNRLWVREAWKPVPASAYRCSEGVQQTPNPNDTDQAAVYRAGWDRSTGGTPWRPSIHMPRWASRLTLTVTAVKVERLQDISEADAMAEGVDPQPPNPTASALLQALGRHAVHMPHQSSLANLWNTLHAPPHDWAGNPEVVAITFDVARVNIDA